MATKFFSMVTYLGGLLSTKPNDALVTGFARSCEKLKPLYLHYHNAYGLGRMVTCFEELLPVKSHDPFISHSNKIT